MIANARTIEDRTNMVAFNLSPLSRINGALFGSPNFRRANGIVEARFDILGRISRGVKRILGRSSDVPVYLCDRKGGKYSTKLPKIWLSEQVSNTSKDEGRVMVECYPSAPDKNGERALELGDRYLGEGNMLSSRGEDTALECFKAAEILYLHSLRRGNRIAASRLRDIYCKDLCKGEYWKSNIEKRARHSKPSVGSWRMGLS